VPVLLTRTLVLLLALRAVAAPVVLCPSAPPSSHQRFFEIRMRCWPPQRLQRFSSSSKLLQLYTGKNRVTSGETGRFLKRCLLRFTPQPPLPVLVPEASPDVATERLAVCLRC
jgi:hypothetical protein